MSGSLPDDGQQAVYFAVVDNILYFVNSKQQGRKNVGSPSSLTGTDLTRKPVV